MKQESPGFSRGECQGVPDRAGLQSVIDVIGEHYLHLAREWGWNDTEVRDAMYVETKQRGWCRE